MNLPRWRVLAAIASVVTAAGCSGTSSSGDGHVTGPTGIRGTELPAFSCDAEADGKALRVAPSKVVEIRICPVGAPEPFNKPSHRISLMRGSTDFQSFVAALSLPDSPPNRNQLCPEYAELLPRIIARTASSALLVHLPSDACGHSAPAARAALSAITNESSATP